MESPDSVFIFASGSDTVTFGNQFFQRPLDIGKRRSLAKYKETALALGARRFVLATTQDWAAETLANAKQAFAGTHIDVVPLVGKDIFT